MAIHVERGNAASGRPGQYHLSLRRTVATEWREWARTIDIAQLLFVLAAEQERNGHVPTARARCLTITAVSTNEVKAASCGAAGTGHAPTTAGRRRP